MSRELAMARNNLLLLVAFIVLPVVVLVGSYLFRSVDTIKLPGPIGTVTAGYPYATQLMAKVAPGAVFCGAAVDLDPTTNGFNPNPKMEAGSTGDPLVPSGHWPDGTESRLRAPASVWKSAAAVAVPGGGSPPGTGQWPVPPILTANPASKFGFKTRWIAYGFRLPDQKKTVLVNVENTSGTAYPMLVTDPDRMAVPMTTFQFLDLTKISIDVPEVLAIAATNDLSSFCAMVPLADRSVDLNLYTGDKGPEWSVVGDGWDDKGPLAELAIEIDATTGEVLKHSITKAVGRP